MAHLCNLQIRVNAKYVFFIDENIIAAFSGRLKKIIKNEKRRTQIKNSGIEIYDFPGGPDGFELVSRFCYGNGRIEITVSNVSLLHCCAVFLGMTEKVFAGNLLHQTESFLAGLFYWSWNDIVLSLKNCQSFLSYADSCGLVQKLICALIAKIAQNSEMNLIASTSSSSSSPETVSGFRFSASSKATPESIKVSKSSKAWWFDDMTVLCPQIIERVIKSLGAYGVENKSLKLTKFLLHYLKSTVHGKGSTSGSVNSRSEYGGLADTAVYGVISVGKNEFSCRRLFWVLRIVSGFSMSKACRIRLERLIGEMLDQATLDDLLVSGHDKGVYDVNLVLRLIRVFVNVDGVSLQRMKRLGILIDKYLGEISPDQNLKILKFLAVAESLPDSARDCFDEVYRAIDIYLESHPTLSFEERSRLCRCLNCSKLTLEACKDLAKNPRIPPNVAVQALMSQQSKIPRDLEVEYESSPNKNSRMILYQCSSDIEEKCSEENNEELKLNLQRMQWRVLELENVCKEMKGQMSRLVRHNVMIASSQGRALPRLC
ncbi:hypothetical protein SLEP1_g47069 [Rubroshorea leprosula]|uniref:NPH3 domain-containing protein n=1 Tax=Rubroshorea leprosula TaxID=152421 RepID=A0AAV5LRE9_9ROSI|nr:hypothetical protein SLEP1_g47069 [Rubroshorea leprosula]